MLKVLDDKVFIEEIPEKRKRLELEWENFKYIKHTEMLRLTGNWERLKILREHMSEARMYRSWKEWSLKFCDFP